MEGIALEYFPNSIDTGINDFFNSCISDDNEQDVCDSHAQFFHITTAIFKSVMLVSCVSTVWEDTYGCAKQYM